MSERIIKESQSAFSTLPLPKLQGRLGCENTEKNKKMNEKEKGNLQFSLRNVEVDINFSG